MFGLMERKPSIALQPTIPQLQITTPELVGSSYDELGRLKTILDNYEATQRDLGIRVNDQVIATRLKIFLVEEKINVYPYSAVAAFLNAKAKEIHGENGSWEWVALRPQDTYPSEGGVCLPSERTAHRVRHREPGDIRHTHWQSSNLYNKAVPIQVLRRVQEIYIKFPHAHFYVSEIIDLADPFLALTSKGSPMYVIAHWNEPQFTY